MAKSVRDPQADRLPDYRKVLEQRLAEVSAEYGKAVITLSGGALAVSFAFVTDLVPDPIPSTVWRLWLAWLSFGTSLASILLAMLTATFALRHAIKQVDDGTIDSDDVPGRWRSRVTSALNVSAIITFFAGIFFLAYFALTNLRGDNDGCSSDSSYSASSTVSAASEPSRTKRGDLRAAATAAAASDPT